MKPERILAVDDTPANLALLSEALEPRGYEILAASNGAEALRLALRAKPALVLLDLMMPGQDGYAVCSALRQLGQEGKIAPDLPIIFVTARHDTPSLMRGFAAGAVDYIAKPFRAEEVQARVETHLQLHRLTRELQRRNVELQAEMDRRQAAESAHDRAQARLSTLAAREAQHWGVAGLIGCSPHLRRILSEIERLFHFGKTSVLITGESGTGKELVARAIHLRSPRAEKPFIPVNCVAVPAELIESAFFGHVKGAFTGATTDRKGYFEQADGGTLFLDEIGDMPAALQAKLLRALEDGEITPVGGSQARQVDVRVLAATNADLGARIADREFRQDLYFRLARFTVHTPPLRDRPEDVALLAAHFLERFSVDMGFAPPPLTPPALRLLQGYAFPGNVRELKNCLERALILGGGGPIGPEHLQFLAAPGEALRPAATMAIKPPEWSDLPFNLEAAEQALIQRALEQTGGNVVEAARLLGVNRSRIYRRFPRSAESAVTPE
jgi:DNA-binding NtrC family response regulator